MVSSWIKAIRLRTLPLAGASLTLGASLAHLYGAFDWTIYGLSLATAFLLQIASNLANDYGDAVSGLDGADREGPSRTIQDGLITQRQMRLAIVITCLLAFGVGLVLINYAFSGWLPFVIFLGLGLVAIIAALKYTMGKNPYGYAGWGDVFVLIFFGWVGVGATFFLYTETWNSLLLLPASALGLLAVGVLNVNNIRDIQSDEKAGKYSIPVRIGRANAVTYHGFLLLTALLAMILFGIIQDFQDFQWLFLLATPLLVKNWWAVKREVDPKKLDPYLKQMALTTLLLVLLFVIGNYVNGQCVLL